MKSIPNGISNSMYNFSVHTRFTGDIQPANRLKMREHSNKSVDDCQIQALRDALGNEAIFLNTGQEIRIPVKASSISARLHNGKIHIIYL